MATVTRMLPVIEGPVADWTDRKVLYDADRLKRLLDEVEAGRKCASMARRNLGRVSRAQVDSITLTLTSGGLGTLVAYRTEPSPAKRRVGSIVIKTSHGKRMVFDAESIRLLAAAGAALGRMWLQLRTGRSRPAVGPIVLKRFETALEAFEQYQSGNAR